MTNDLSRLLTRRLSAVGCSPLAEVVGSQPPRDGFRRLTPPLAYGRHHGPAPAAVRRAAVAIMWLQDDDGDWHLPLTMRPQTLRHHGGQVCFPGGKIEGDETPAEAALREFDEELGGMPNQLQLCGEISPLYVYASNNLVYPVIFTARQPRAAWRPDPAEVERVIDLPLETVRKIAVGKPEVWTRQIRKNQQVVGEYQMQTRSVRYRGDRIWGATAMLLQQVAELLAGSTDEQQPSAKPLRATA